MAPSPLTLAVIFQGTLKRKMTADTNSPVPIVDKRPSQGQHDNGTGIKFYSEHP